MVIYDDSFVIVTPCLIGRVFFCVFELVILSGVNFSFSSTLIIENRGCPTSRQIGTNDLKILFRSFVSV